MKLKFKNQSYQTAAVEAVADCFKGQPKAEGISYRMDPGRSVEENAQTRLEWTESGFRNADFKLPSQAILENIQQVQRRQNLPQSRALAKSPICDVNLDIEMETGTGKTYCYIKTMLELSERYGWNKFIVVVPSVAIREGVYKSFQITADHFHEQYGNRPRFFIYNSKQLHNLESFSSDSGLNVMIINVQAFNARGQDARRIYEELDDFQSRRPIDVIAKNRPILIIDEPQKIEGTKGKASKSFESLKEFHPLMILRYSATHKKEHNKVYRLDALDAYNLKLVKKIAVRGIQVKNLPGTNAYLYLESILISQTKPPEARAELEIKQKNGIKRVFRKIRKGTNLYDLSGGLDEYKGFIISEIDARDNTIAFTNGATLQSGQATGDVNDLTLRRIQIRETIKAHFEKERQLFDRGIKVLSLFFIDDVAKYRYYEDGEAQAGEYAQIFEEEYQHALNEVLTLEDTPYNRYLKGIETGNTHEGYFSIDKKGHYKNPKAIERGENEGETDDVNAYDLILKNKERLLSFEEPVRFIFSHSALREGWDNPNVFVICALKHSDNTISRRQEVGRGLRLCVNQRGDRIDAPEIVHNINVLTVVANESYQEFVSGLQKNISASLSDRPRTADEAYFLGKLIHQTQDGNEVTINAGMARQVEYYLIQNGFVDSDKYVTEKYHEAKREGKLPELPPDLQPYAAQIFRLVDSVFDDSQLPTPENERGLQEMPPNENFEKKEFKKLWNRINKQAAYTVHFETEELVQNCIKYLNQALHVAPLQYFIQRGEQHETASSDDLLKGEAFAVSESQTQKMRASAHSSVSYDLVGKLAESTQLKRQTIVEILKGLERPVFAQFKENPEEFLSKASRLINEQKATVIVEQIVYNPLDKTHSLDIFTREKMKVDVSRDTPVNRHIYDYVQTDSENEREFVSNLDTSNEVVVYSKLPKGFYIPTPVGNYNPDWAIAFEEGKVRHVYFIAETKGSMSSMELREIEKSKIKCARRFFENIANKEVKYQVVDSYKELIDAVT